MITLPAEIMTRRAPFAPLFSSRVWRHAQVLVVGAILAPSQRMVRMVLRGLGLSHLSTFSTSHRVVNRAVWSSLAVSPVLLGLRLGAFVPRGPVVSGGMKRWSVGAGPRSRPKASIALPPAPARRIVPRRAGCAGAV